MLFKGRQVPKQLSLVTAVCVRDVQFGHRRSNPVRIQHSGFLVAGTSPSDRTALRRVMVLIYGSTQTRSILGLLLRRDEGIHMRYSAAEQEAQGEGLIDCEKHPCLDLR